jgi:hypothetical protein
VEVKVDALWIGLVVVFFLLSFALLAMCARLMERP